VKRVLIFESTYALLKAERVLKRHALTYEIQPTPRHFSSDCGMCLVLEGEVDAPTRALLQGQGVACEWQTWEDA
jgi:hypothetical protein